MTQSSTTMVFPHPELTRIEGTPTNRTIQTIQKQLYANALAHHSTRGGGANGHLALLMSDADYLARAGVEFLPPVHPGNAPIYVANATGSQIAEGNRQYNQDLCDFQQFFNLKTALKQQLLAAIRPDFVRILEDPEFGYSDVLPSTMLTHLKDTYCQISRDDIEENHNKLSMDLNVDDPIEFLWLRLKEIQRFALAAGEPITDDTVIQLTLPIFEKTGVFGTVTEKWSDRPYAEWTLANFKTHFEKGNKERLRKLAAKTAGDPTSAGSVASTIPSTIDTTPEQPFDPAHSRDRCRDAIKNKDCSCVTMHDMQHFFAEGRRNELVIEKKINGADKLAVLVGFLLAFMIANILSLDPETFNSDMLFNVFAVCLTFTACWGLYCSIVLAFLSVKVRRLLGRTIYNVGTVEDLPFKHGGGGIKKMREYMLETSAGTNGSRLSARKWYSENGKLLYQSSLVGFIIFLMGFVVSACVKLADTLDTVFIYICLGMLIVTMITALGYLWRSDALRDLG
jgi:hypothetical protein